MEGIRAERIVEVPGERFKGVVEVEAIPDDVAHHRQIGNLLGLKARRELGFDLVVSLEDLDLAEDRLLRFVEGVDVRLQDLGVVCRERTPHHDTLTVLVLLGRVSARLAVHGA